MNGVRLLEAMGYVDERYIQEAEDTHIRKAFFHRWRPVLAAACLCLAVIWMVNPFTEDSGKMTEKIQGANDQISAGGRNDSASVGADTAKDEPFVILWIEEVTFGTVTAVIEEAGDFDTLAPGARVQLISVPSDRETSSCQEDTVETDPIRDAIGQRLWVHVVSYDPETNILIVDNTVLIQEKG